MKALCKVHQNVLLFWCKGCSKAMCQKCVVEHSMKQFRKIHNLVELSTLKSDVQKEANELSQELDFLYQTLLPEYNLVEQQRIGLQLLQRSQLILQQAISNYFSELKHTFIALTSNHSNITQKKQLQEELEKVMNELKEYAQSTDFQVSEFFERDFKSIIKQMRENVSRFIEKTKIEYKKPNLKINEKFTHDLSQILSNYVSITFERTLLERAELRVPKPKQTLHFTVERNNSQRIERKMTLLNPSNLAQSQVLNHTYLQAITEQNLEDQLIQQFDQSEEIQKIVILDQSKVRYLHSLIDPQTLFIHDIQLKENQLISLPESAQIPQNAQTLITSDLVLYICGGTNNGQPSHNFYQFDNSQGLIQLQNIPTPVHQHSILYNKGFLYIIGGKTIQGATDKCWRYVVNNKQWEEFATLNQPRTHHQSCSFESEDQTTIYTFFGLGKDGNLLDSIEKYSNVERKWQNILIKNMISGIASLKCCCVQLDEQRILIYGGYYKNLKNSNKMITFSIETATIDNLNQLCLPIGQLQGQPITNNNALYSLHNCPDQIVPKYSEFGDVLQILEINNTSCHFADIINCRQLTLKKN